MVYRPGAVGSDRAPRGTGLPVLHFMWGREHSGARLLSGRLQRLLLEEVPALSSFRPRALQFLWGRQASVADPPLEKLP